MMKIKKSLHEAFGHCIYSRVKKLKECKTAEDITKAFIKEKNTLLSNLYLYPTATYQAVELIDDNNQVIDSNIIFISDQMRKRNDNTYYIVVMKGNRVMFQDKFEHFSKYYNNINYNFVIISLFTIQINFSSTVYKIF